MQSNIRETLESVNWIYNFVVCERAAQLTTSLSKRSTTLLPYQEPWFKWNINRGTQFEVGVALSLHNLLAAFIRDYSKTPK